MKDLDKTRIETDENAVTNVMELVTSMINPFDNSIEGLVHLSSGTVANEDIERDMSNMFQQGETAAMDFIQTNILSSSPDIYSPIKKIKLKTFTSLSTKVHRKNKKGEIVALKNSKNLFAKMLLIAKTRELDMKNVLKYSLRPFPSPLATLEGSLVKTVKAKLLGAIEEEIDDPDLYPERIDGEKALIIDAMAVLQTVNVLPNTFGELAMEVLQKIVNMAISSKSKRVDFVADRYPEHSIKNLERDRRSVNGVNIVRIYGENQRVPRQWKKFMSAGQNKEELMKFFCEAWKKANVELLRGVELYVTDKEECVMFQQQEDGLHCSLVEGLWCNQEEADTRMICHANHAALSYPNIIINSPDTDVFFIALNSAVSINASVFFETGTRNKRRIISLEIVKRHLGLRWCSALLGFHSFTGNVVKNCKLITFSLL